jgi:hypothetical protein
MIEGDDMRLDYEQQHEYEWETGWGEAWREAPRTRRPPIVIPPVVICGGPPNQRLGGFALNVATPTPRIEIMIHCVACMVVRREHTAAPVRNICLEGHTDNTGPVDFNNNLGLSARERSRNVSSAPSRFCVPDSRRRSHSRLRARDRGLRSGATRPRRAALATAASKYF